MGRPVSSLVTVRNSSCGKVMFSQASLILSTGRGWGSGRHPPSRADTPRQTPPLGRHSARQTPLRKTPLVRHPLGGRPLPLGRHHHLPRSDITPPPGRPPHLPLGDCHWSGRYAFYWNAFLLSQIYSY